MSRAYEVEFAPLENGDSLVKRLVEISDDSTITEDAGTAGFYAGYENRNQLCSQMFEAQKIISDTVMQVKLNKALDDILMNAYKNRKLKIAWL